MNEAELLSQLKQGKPQAVRQWYAEFSPKISRYIHRKVSVKEDAEELVQFVFVDCLKQLPLFLGHSSLLTWMMAITNHVVADYYRRKYAKKAVQTIPLLNTLLLPTQDAKEHDVAQLVQSVLRKMSRYSRELLMQKYIDGAKVLDISKGAGKSVKATESELFRARKEFRLLFLKESEET